MQTSSRESIEYYVRNGYWGEESLESLFRRTVAIHPGRVALADPPDKETFTEGKPCRLTYSDLFTAVRDVSARLLSAGLKKDQVVVSQLPNTVETVVLYLALARIGALVCPVPVEKSCASLTGLALQLEPVMYVGCRYQHRDFLKQARTWLPESCQLASFSETGDDEVLNLSFETHAGEEEIKHLGKIMDSVPVSPNEVFTLAWKRDEEGARPAIPRTHNQWFALASFVYEGAGLRNGDTLFCGFSLAAASGIGAFLYNWLMAGARLVLDQTGDTEQVISLISQERVTCAGVPPAVLAQIKSYLEANDSHNLGCLRTLVSGFASIDSQLADDVARLSGVNVLNCYGTSEGASLLAVPADRCERWSGQLFPRFCEQVEGWGSRMSRMVSTRLVDPGKGEEITAPEQPGELYVKGPSLFDGYYQPPGTAEDDDDDDDGFQRTGDLFVIDEDNPRFYRFIGRMNLQTESEA
ncbi:acyl--CoA ligase [Sansalvadorimonas sp. 2012CJ34-2]|uniref:Acyl--CoA ligase n=1 Tax=Parendozoicomonas callyspongiae TaxID=2942213 RepID=A0ABT0PK93_9GAMM|nr:class I adenylate-forming enzyme family protein [Sansalvadorimonas sp. 2012CJ34-2]MCL6271812.1 acyl--CoA ligase [Sansalvadorimonas sp. 2012CJ34-2]